MEKIILFGGTFDPPHEGHMALLAASIEAVQPGLVLVMPTGIPPHKTAGHTDAALRLAMCACFLPLFSPMILDETEILRKGKSYTIDTVHTLQKRYSNAEIYLPMGSDMLLYFKHWYGYQELLAAVTLVVQCRKNEDVAPVHALVKELRDAGAHIIFTKGEIERVSSTEIRKKVAAGQNINALVPQDVAKIIAQHHLYCE
ncbi:MAG: nicotinate (nicotinamide) nucleotide adenylyltransferase [Ruthenibacterium sp.]